MEDMSRLREMGMVGDEIMDELRHGHGHSAMNDAFNNNDYRRPSGGNKKAPLSANKKKRLRKASRKARSRT